MPGLSAYAANPERAGLGLQPLIDFAVATFQALNITDRIPKSPIYLKATGGMRALQEDTRDQVMAHVHAFLMNTGFYFKVRLDEYLCTYLSVLLCACLFGDHRTEVL